MVAIISISQFSSSQTSGFHYFYLTVFLLTNQWLPLFLSHNFPCHKPVVAIISISQFSSSQTSGFHYFCLTVFLVTNQWVPLFLSHSFPCHKPVRGARWLSGRVSDSGARGPGFETYRRRVVSLSKTLYSPKVLVNYPGSDGSVPT